MKKQEEQQQEKERTQYYSFESVELEWMNLRLKCDLHQISEYILLLYKKEEKRAQNKSTSNEIAENFVISFCMRNEI